LNKVKRFFVPALSTTLLAAALLGAGANASPEQSTAPVAQTASISAGLSPQDAALEAARPAVITNSHPPIVNENSPNVHVLKGGLKAPKRTMTDPRKSAKFALAAGPVYTYADSSQFVTALGFAVNMHVANPFLKTTAPADYHSLAEQAAQSTDGRQIVEVGWTKDPTICSATVSKLCLFVYHWVNHTESCYNGCGFVNYTPPAPAVNIDPGADLSADVGTQPTWAIQFFNNQWWVSYNGQWLGYFPLTLWTSPTATECANSLPTSLPPGCAGPNYNALGLLQSFTEIAAQTATTCSDHGNGKLGTNPDPGALRMGSLSLISPTPSTAVPDYTVGGSSPGKIETYKASSRTTRNGGPGWNAAGTGNGTTGSC
jgi:hypothetical protein